MLGMGAGLALAQSVSGVDLRTVDFSRPDAVVMAYLTALQERDYPTMYALTTRAGQARIGLPEFQALVEAQIDQALRSLAPPTVAAGVYAGWQDFEVVAVYPPQYSDGAQAVVWYTLVYGAKRAPPAMGAIGEVTDEQIDRKLDELYAFAAQRRGVDTSRPDWNWLRWISENANSWNVSTAEPGWTALSFAHTVNGAAVRQVLERGSSLLYLGETPGLGPTWQATRRVTVDPQGPGLRIERSPALVVLEQGQWRLPMRFDEEQRLWALPLADPTVLTAAFAKEAGPAGAPAGPGLGGGLGAILRRGVSPPLRVPPVVVGPNGLAGIVIPALPIPARLPNGERPVLLQLFVSNDDGTSYQEIGSLLLTFPPSSPVGQ